MSWLDKIDPKIVRAFNACTRYGRRTWLQRNGILMKIEDMTDDHLEHVYLMLRTGGAATKEEWEDALASFIDYRCPDKTVRHSLHLDWIIEELECRGFEISVIDGRNNGDSA